MIQIQYIINNYAGKKLERLEYRLVKLKYRSSKFIVSYYLQEVDYENFKERRALEERERRRRERDYGYQDRGYDPEDEEYDVESPRVRRTGYDRR